MPVSSLVVEGGPIGACPGDVGLWKPMEAWSASSADDRRATNRQSPCIGGGRYTRAQCASSGAEKNR